MHVVITSIIATLARRWYGNTNFSPPYLKVLQTPLRTWHTSPNAYALLGSASSGHHTGNDFAWPAKLLSNPVALEGMFFRQRLDLLLITVVGVSKGMRPQNTCYNKTSMKMQRKVSALSPRQPSKWAGSAKNPLVKN